MRAALRARRDAFAVGRPPIVPPPQLLDRLERARIVAVYQPLGSEADPAAIADAARARGCALALPVTASRAEPIRFARWSPDRPLVAGPLGLRQPAPDAPAVAPDLVVLPLVGFDGGLNRLGQGAGHYDRALERLPDAFRVGLAWSVQAVDALPVDPWDIPLDALLTEAGWTAR